MRLNSVEPQSRQLTAINVFGAGAAWSKLRRSEVVDLVVRRPAYVAAQLGDKDWLKGAFTIGDMMMVDIADAILDMRMANRTWAARTSASPTVRQASALFYADWAHPLGTRFLHVKAIVSACFGAPRSHVQSTKLDLTARIPPRRARS